ncbi:DNA cytosine methyltransferase [Mucilaginibacter sp. CSA2-8R]|uniref:DNA cytosine methyltransferase n=1 Tax=Mucilaginibacter sp. CSA2-8R TaxID=3141542 RepID=UPI00315CBF7A
MIGIELFSGAGGMSLGATMAGVNVKMAVEIDRSAAETFKANHPEALVFAKDIRELDQIPLKQIDETKILFGGPPCQGFSRSNHRTRNADNDKNWLFEEFARVTVLWSPDWIVLENVEGLIGTNNGFFFKTIVERFTDLGYTITHKVLNAFQYGVPQKRTRLFIVGSKHGVKFEFPEPYSTPHLSVKDALEDLPDLCNGNKLDDLDYKAPARSQYCKTLRGALGSCSNHGVSTNTPTVIERYQFIPQGGNWRNIPQQHMGTYKDVTRCHTGIYHRLDFNKPSVVIGNFRKNMLIHPTQDRGLSVREAARLQSFPDWFCFKGTLNEQQQQVGNAVPPFLAKAIFEKISTYQ